MTIVIIIILAILIIFLISSNSKKDTEYQHRQDEYDKAQQELTKLEAEYSSYVEPPKEDYRYVETKIPNAERTKEGWIYIISNLGSFGKGIYKVGLTRRDEPQKRIDELGDASVPFPFDVHAVIWSEDAPALESELHKALKDYHYNKVNSRKEFFEVDLEVIRDLVVDAGFPIEEFYMDHPAEQYNKSIELCTTTKKKQNTKDTDTTSLLMTEEK